VGEFAYGGQSTPAGYEGGIVIENVQSISLFLISVILFYIFVRFGYHYYQGNILIASLQRMIITELKADNDGLLTDKEVDQLKQILLHVCKENYLIQAFVVMRKSDSETGLEGGEFYKFISKFLSCIMIFIFVYFMGFSQYISIIFLNEIFAPLAFFTGLVFISFYIVFYLAIIWDFRTPRDKNRPGFTLGSPFDGSPFSPIFVIFFSIVVFLNVYSLGDAMMAGSDPSKYIQQENGKRKFELMQTLWGYHSWPLSTLPKVFPNS